MAQIKQETIDEIFDLGRDIEETVNGVRELCHGKFPDKVVEPIEVAVKQLTAARTALWQMLKERGLSTSEIAELAAVEDSEVAVVLLQGSMQNLSNKSKV